MFAEKHHCSLTVVTVTEQVVFREVVRLLDHQQMARTDPKL